MKCVLSIVKTPTIGYITPDNPQTSALFDEDSIISVSVVGVREATHRPLKLSISSPDSMGVSAKGYKSPVVLLTGIPFGAQVSATGIKEEIKKKIQVSVTSCSRTSLRTKCLNPFNVNLSLEIPNTSLSAYHFREKIELPTSTHIRVSLAVANAIVKGESVANIKGLLVEAVEQKYNVTLSANDIKVIVEAAEWIAYLYLTSDKKFYISSDNKLYVRNVL